MLKWHQLRVDVIKNGTASCKSVGIYSRNTGAIDSFEGDLKFKEDIVEGENVKHGKSMARDFGGFSETH